MTYTDVHSVYDKWITVQERDCEDIIRLFVLERKCFKMNAIKTWWLCYQFSFEKKRRNSTNLSSLWELCCEVEKNFRELKRRSNYKKKIIQVEIIKLSGHVCITISDISI